ncbi:F-box protein PP2-B10-like [Musa acuminata AAA Group]|uniref:F-box protein PP2-B10-like n=1 Tax=Musa acuminata AAA Group TaxID=214697 RepID=UPI0031D2B809
MEKGESRTEKLPELCIVHAISLTSPRVASRLSAVSTTFRAAATSDTVWDRFLPSDWQSLVSRAVHPVDFSSFSSKRDIFFRLCDPILIDDGKMSFSLDRSSGAKCYVLSARKLSITWADAPWYWKWRCLPESRFADVAELLDVYWLEIRGKIESRMLSQKTAYAAYLIYRTSDEAYGLTNPSQEASVKVGVYTSTKLVCLLPIDILSESDAHRASPSYKYQICCCCEDSEEAEEEDGDSEEAEEVDGDSEEAEEVDGDSEEAEEEDGDSEEAEEVDEEVDGDSEEAEEVDGDSEEAEEVDGAPKARNDDWMELELGEFYTDEGDDGEVNISLLEVKGNYLKSGLIIEGIEIRPKQ